jgi:CDP-archaeol synthase
MLPKLLLLLLLANGTPVIAKDIFRGRFAHPLDGGARLGDGQPVFGSSKTVRGIFLSIAVTAAFAPAAGFEWKMGALVAGVAMAGDLLSSFVKRRLKMAPGSRATGLDQIPESLFPLLACRTALSLTAAEIALTVAIFFAGEILLSRLLYRLRLRERPY